MTSLPPVVEPGPELTVEQLQRYSRHLLLPGLGTLGQRRLLNASVCVVGAGGLGSPALLYLAAAGVGQLTVVDHDVVEVSNLQRQVLHRSASVGASKAESARIRVGELNPGVEVVARPSELTTQTAADLLAGHDVVLDGTDNFATRYLISDACRQLGLPLVWGAVLRYDAQVSTFVGPPLVPEHEAVQLRDLFPSMPAAEAVPSCAEAGVLGALCGQVGSIMATEVIKLITGLGEPLVGRVLVVDGASMRSREIALRPAPVAASHMRPTVAVSPAGQPDSSRAADLPVMTPVELSAQRADLTVLDVREAVEHEMGTIPGAHLVPLGELMSWGSLGDLQGGTLVVTCKTGPRAEQAAHHLRLLGHGDVRLLSGGMLAWAEDVDPSLPRY